MKIILGNRYRDKISGVEGIATVKTDYLNGCTQYSLVAGTNPQNGKILTHYIYEQQLEPVKK